MLGTHGIPASYGGFETAAENIAKDMLAHGWEPVVYCQGSGSGPIVVDEWNGISRVTIPVARDGWLGTSEFDWRSIMHAVRSGDPCLTFGYNTALFNVVQRVMGIPNVINMDGIEWSRARWGKFRQAILYVNERIACLVGNELIADHPQIAAYLSRKAPSGKITTITYGANAVDSASVAPVAHLHLIPGRYLTLVCRPIPENSILELVRAFSRRHRGVLLAVVGGYSLGDDYQRAVMAAASDEVKFVGPVYEPSSLAALRFHGLGYLHGHTVGGTNPSLVEAMAAGNPIVAHDNVYNRWVAQDSALYFRDEDQADEAISQILESTDVRSRLSQRARDRHAEEFTWTHVAGQYRSLLGKYALPAVDAANGAVRR
ncbi:glycosyltransferase family 1 protein [Glaciibacter flavus]|uniref:Glycosyltransferase family 1 protein n=1 Tax=Orlajensenia flava TaxID=2565934 RepID=A0A4V3WT53_9MICO|nr:DUF1972 domain-containing protein [Glaciibacter flavus]THG30627.1 glycosyltransferase family 1 protein [Glaciibacter flavus]